MMEKFNLYITFMDFMSIEKKYEVKIKRILNYMDKICIFFMT